MENEREAQGAQPRSASEAAPASKLATPHRARWKTSSRMVDEGGGKAQLKLILKCDVQGSVEAIKKAVLADRDQEDRVPRSSPPPPARSPSPTSCYAGATDAIVSASTSRSRARPSKPPRREEVQIKLYSIIYELIDQVKEAMARPA